MRTAESAKRLMERRGRAVTLVPNAVAGYGVEALLTGSESGALTCKGLFQEPEMEPPPQGNLDGLRFADAQGGPSGEWEFVTSAAYFTSAPTEDYRLVDDEKTYAVVKVRPTFSGQEPATYRLLLRLI